MCIRDRGLAAVLVLLVGLSGTMMAIQGGASATMVGLTTIGGLLVGGVLAWYFAWLVS